MSEPQVSALAERLEPVSSKRAGIALGLWGEAGIGKSHTAAELLARLPHRSMTLPGNVPLRQWLQALPRSSKLATWAERTLTAGGEGRTPDRANLVAALAALLEALAPFVLHIEDIHDSTPDRYELVRQLARAARRVRGVGILVTSRNEPPEPFVAVKCEALDHDRTLGLLEAEIGMPLPTSATDWLFAKAAGNPLYTLEFLHYLARQGFLWSDGRHWHWRPPDEAFLPTTVEALIEELIAQASAIPDDGHVLEARALLEGAASKSIWARVARVSDGGLDASIQRLTQGGVLSNSSDFGHPLVRDVTLRSLTPERQRDLARRAVDALKDDPVAAAPFIDRAELPDDVALGLLEAAADRVSDNVRAARLRSRATLYAHGDARARLALAAALVLQHHDLSEALRLSALAFSNATPDADAVILYAHLLARSGRQEDVDALLVELPPELRGHIEPTVLQLTSRNVAGDHQEAWAIWEAHPELHAAPSPELLRAVAASALAIGRMREARALTQEGLASTQDEASRCEFLSLQSLIAFHSGDARVADATIRQALELLAGMDLPRQRATALLNRAAYLRMLGEYTAMGECLEGCLRLRQIAGEGKASAFALAALAELRIEQGRYEQADDMLTEAISTLELYGPSRFLINARAMASLLSTSQATALSRLTALKHGEEALAGARQLGSPRVIREMLFDASVANTYAGHAPRGLTLAQESRDLADAAGNAPNDEYRTLWALALAREALGDREESVALLEHASRLADANEGAIDAHKIGLELDRLRGDIDSARVRSAWFEERGLMNGAAIARRYFPSLSSTEATAPEAHMRLEVLGPMQLLAEEVTPVRGAKRRHLLALLLEARVGGHATVPKLTLLDELYRDQDETKASSSLKELVRGLRSMFGRDLIVTTPAGYALGACTSDVEQFLADADAALWRGPYLDGIDLEGPVRDSLYVALASSAQGMCSADPREAARLGAILVEAEPFRLDHLTILLEALRAAGNHRSLERQYQAARARLAELGETLPDRWQDFLTPQEP